MDNHQVTKNDESYLRSLPSLEENFCTTFKSVYVQTKDIRLHTVIGGEGCPLVLLAGWPQTWFAWRFIMLEMAKSYTVIAIDPRGAGLSEKPETGYDTGTMANDVLHIMDILGYSTFAMVGMDIGMWTAYALAADHPGVLNKLVVIDATIPGISPSAPLLANDVINNRLWHFAFNRVEKVNELLVKGREEIYFGYQFASKAAKPTAIPQYAIKVYVSALKASDEALTASFSYYRVLDTTIAQNENRKKDKLKIPVLAIGGEKGVSHMVKKTMELVADNVMEVIIPDCGHFVAEEAPEQLVNALIPFLAPGETDH